jgi:hypothetical protein
MDSTQPNIISCCNSALCELQDYMFFKETIDDVLKYVSDCSKNDKPLKEALNTNDALIVNNDSLYKPHQKDSLFWCFYILSRGSSAYEMIGNKHFTVEKNEKIKLVELVRDKKALLKQHKITPLSSVENDLTNGETISISTFFAICIASNIEVLYVNKENNTYFTLFEETCTPGDTINVLYKSDISHRFECDGHGEASLISSTEKTHFKLFSINKSIQPISAYKSLDLLEICKKMGIDGLTEGHLTEGHQTEGHQTEGHKVKLKNKQWLYNALQHKLN